MQTVRCWKAGVFTGLQKALIFILFMAQVIHNGLNSMFTLLTLCLLVTACLIVNVHTHTLDPECRVKQQATKR